MPVSRRATDRFATWVEEALDKHAMGDDVTFDVAFAAMQEGPALIIGFFLPGLVLGEYIQASVVTGNPAGVTQAGVERLVIDMLEALRRGRSEQAAQAPQPNGSGLLLPRG